ncbi:MAG: hypothetical protein AB7F22_29005 [Reyranella sp.]|uniref:hypothetical protein n=1 Tax=Reyranella sp. TaxID=1929291 RepID=UPI003D0E3800
MAFADDARALENRAKDEGIDMKEVLRLAGIHRATWDRWKAGSFGPQMRKWDAVVVALNTLMEAKAA